MLHVCLSRGSCGRAAGVIHTHTAGHGLKKWWGRYNFYRGSDSLPPYQHHKIERSPVCGRSGKDSVVGSDPRH